MPIFANNIVTSDVHVPLTPSKVHLVIIAHLSAAAVINKIFIIIYVQSNEPCHEKKKKQIFAYAKTKAQISFAVTAKLISAFVFTTRIIKLFLLLYPKFQASSLFFQDCIGQFMKS